MFRRLTIAVLFLLLVLGLGLAARQIPTLDRLIDHELALREIVRSRPWSSWFVGLLAYTAISLIPGTSGKAIVCGWLFGFVQAVLMVNFGLTLAAITSFLIGRWAWRNVERKNLPQWIVKGRKLLDGEKIQRHAASYLLGLRLLHAPYSLTNYGAASTSVRLKTFWWTTQIGTLPGIIVFTFAGTRIPTLAVVANEGVISLLDPPLLAALAVMTAFPAFVHHLIHQRLQGSSRLRDQTSPEPPPNENASKPSQTTAPGNRNQIRE